MNRLDIIQKIINLTKAKTYLEIGVEFGTVFLPIKAERKIAVEPYFKIPLYKKFFSPGFFKNKYFEMTSNDFFNKQADLFMKNKIDIAFIDGLHTYEQSLKDFDNCLKYLNEKGVIIMHDCNPTTKAMATVPIELAREMPDWSGSWCGNVWKTIVYLRSTRDDLKIFVIDEDYGLGVITRGRPENTLNYSIKEIRDLSYDHLNKYRNKLLNLQKAEYLNKFL